MMWALYYRNPKTGELLPCINTNRMTFGEVREQPILLAQAANVEKQIRYYKRALPERLEAAAKIDRPGWQLADCAGRMLPGADTADHFVVVPIPIEPDFSQSYNYS